MKTDGANYDPIRLSVLYPLTTSLARRARLFLDARRAAAQLAQVVQAGAAHLAVTHHLNLVDARRVALERTLHADAAGDLAHRERRRRAGVADADYVAFEDLDA